MSQVVRPKGPRKINTFFNDKALADCVVKFGKHKVFAHKLVLVHNSVWFERALLGGFKEAGEGVIDLGDEDNPIAVNAMLRYFYEGTYHVSLPPGQNHLKQHLVMYLLADMYDAPALRKEVTSLFIDCLEVSMDRPGNTINDTAIISIQQILGPGAGSFADKTLQKEVFQLVLEHVTRLYKNQLFQKLLISGHMFDQDFGLKFACKTGEMLCVYYEL